MTVNELAKMMHAAYQNADCQKLDGRTQPWEKLLPKTRKRYRATAKKLLPMLKKSGMTWQKKRSEAP